MSASDVLRARTCTLAAGASVPLSTTACQFLSSPSLPGGVRGRGRRSSRSNICTCRDTNARSDRRRPVLSGRRTYFQTCTTRSAERVRTCGSIKKKTQGRTCNAGDRPEFLFVCLPRTYYFCVGGGQTEHFCKARHACSNSIYISPNSKGFGRSCGCLFGQVASDDKSHPSNSPDPKPFLSMT